MVGCGTLLNEFCKIAGNQQTIFSFLSRPNLQFCRSLNTSEREGGNVHSPPDIHYSKEPTKDKRLMRRPSPSQKPAGKGKTDAAGEQNAGCGDHSRGTKAHLLTPCRQIVPFNEKADTILSDFDHLYPGYGIGHSWLFLPNVDA